MNNIFELLLIEAALCISTFILLRKEFFSCSFLTNISFFISTLLLYRVSFIWEIDIGKQAIFLIFIGLLSASLGDLIAMKLFRTKRIEDVDIRCKYISIKYCNILLFIYVIATILYYHEIRKLGADLGFSDISSIGEVKANVDSVDSMNPIIKQMYKVITAASLIHVLIFAHNVFLAGSTLWKEVRHIIPVLCCVAITISSGGRVNIYMTLAGSAFIIYMIDREKTGWRSYEFLKFFKFAFPVLLIFVTMFTALRLVVKGNADSREEIATSEYLSYYIGGPIQVFNLKVEDGREAWSYETFGHYTFYELYKIFGVDEDSKSKYIGAGMIDLEGQSNVAGNAFTIFGGAYEDFDTIGMCIFIFLLYFLFSKFYYGKILNTYSSYRRNLTLIIYAFCFSRIIALAFYDNSIYILLSQTGFLTLLIIYLLYVTYFKVLVVEK